MRAHVRARESGLGRSGARRRAALRLRLYGRSPAQGKWELEQWVTDREGQAFGHFHDFKFRTQVEYGLTDNFQLSGYLNYSYLNAKNNSVAHLTEGIDIPFDHDPTKAYSAMRFDGISVEGIFFPRWWVD